MQWRDTEEGVIVVVDGEDERQGFRLPPMAPKPPSRAAQYAIGCLGLPFFLVGSCLTSVNHEPRLNAMGYAIIIAVLLLAVLAGGKFAAPQRVVQPLPIPPPRASFAIQLEPAGLRFTCGLDELAFIALSDIAEIVGTTHVDVVRQDGERVRLPCPLSPLETERIASELTARIRGLRAARADYRGIEHD